MAKITLKLAVSLNLEHSTSSTAVMKHKSVTAVTDITCIGFTLSRARVSVLTSYVVLASTNRTPLHMAP